MNEVQAQLPLHALKIHTEWPILHDDFCLGAHDLAHRPSTAHASGGLTRTPWEEDQALRFHYVQAEWLIQTTKMAYNPEGKDNMSIGARHSSL